MAPNLATTRDLVELQLADVSNLIWSADTIDAAIQNALGDLASAYETEYTLEGLDGALVNNFNLYDYSLIVDGAIAYALYTRTAQRLEQATPEGISPALADLARYRMDRFQLSLTQIRVSRYEAAAAKAERDHVAALKAAEDARIADLQASATAPHSEWEWEEGTDFA